MTADQRHHTPQYKARDLVAEIRKTNLSDIERRLIAAIDRDLTGAPIADGWPTTLGGDHGGNAELTSVEAAAERRANLDGTQRAVRDLHHEHTVNANQYLLDAANALNACRRRLDEIARLVSGELPDGIGRFSGAGNCLACHRPCSGHEHDRLRAGLCDPCRKAWERQGRPDRAEFIHRRRPYDETDRVPIAQPG